MFAFGLVFAFVAQGARGQICQIRVHTRRYFAQEFMDDGDEELDSSPAPSLHDPWAVPSSPSPPLLAADLQLALVPVALVPPQAARGTVFGRRKRGRPPGTPGNPEQRRALKAIRLELDDLAIPGYKYINVGRVLRFWSQVLLRIAPPTRCPSKLVFLGNYFQPFLKCSAHGRSDPRWPGARCFRVLANIKKVSRGHGFLHGDFNMSVIRVPVLLKLGRV